MKRSPFLYPTASLAARGIVQTALDHDDDQIAVLKKYPSVWVKVRAGLEQKMSVMQNGMARITEILER